MCIHLKNCILVDFLFGKNLLQTLEFGFGKNTPYKFSKILFVMAVDAL